MFFSVIKPCEFDNPCLWKLGSYLLIDTGRDLSSLMITFKKDGSQVLEKDISWVVKLAKGCEIYIPFKVAENKLNS